MATHTLLIFDAESAVSRGIVDVLEDWSACGWVERVSFLSIQEIDRRDLAVGQNMVRVPAQMDSPSRFRPLAKVAEGIDIRILALDPVGTDATWVNRREKLHLACKLVFDQFVEPRRVGAIDLIVPWHGGHWDPRMMAWPGWDVLIASPQESSTPQESGFDLFVDPDDAAQIMSLAAHAAAFAATASALWTGIEGAPFDHTHEQDDIRLGRSFHVRLDASEKGDVLRGAFMSHGSLRSPEAILIESTPQIAGRVKELAGLVALAPEPKYPSPPGKQTINWRTAVKLFLSYMLGALIRAPKNIADAVTYKVRMLSAQVLTSAIYGQGSGMQIEVGGVTVPHADPTSVTSEESLGGALEQLSAMGLPIPDPQPATVQAPFWNGVFETAFAFVTGTSQASTRVLEEEGTARYLLIDRVVPQQMVWRAQDGMTLVNGASECPLYDPMECQRALQGLREISEQEDSIDRLDINRNAQSLESATKAWNSSYFGEIGLTLARAIDRHQARIKSLVDSAPQGVARNDDETERIGRSLASFSRLLTTSCLLIAATFGILNFAGFPFVSPMLWAPVVFVTWFMMLLVRWVSVQKKIYELIHRAEKADYSATRLALELPVRIENLRRFHRLYDQYLVWVRLAAVFLREPFGRQEESVHQIPVLQGNVPEAVQTGSFAAHDRTDAIRTASKFSSAKKQLHGLWETFVHESFEQLKTDLDFRAVEPEDVFTLPATKGTGGVFQQWLQMAESVEGDSTHMPQDLASRLDRKHLAATVHRLDKSERSDFDALFVARTNKGTYEDLQDAAARSNPADFSRLAFSTRGLTNGFIQPDPDVRASSNAQDALESGFGLGHVSSILVISRNLSFSDLELKRSESHRLLRDGEVSSDDSGDDATFVSMF